MYIIVIIIIIIIKLFIRIQFILMIWDECKQHHQIKEVLHSKYRGTQRFSHSQMSVRRSRRGGEAASAREPLGTQVTVGPLNAPIQSEAVCEVSESKSDSETSKQLLIGSAQFKGPNVCTQRLSHLAFSPHARSWARKTLSGNELSFLRKFQAVDHCNTCILHPGC